MKLTMAQWQIDKKLERAERRLVQMRAKAVLWRQINDIDSKLKMLKENKALYPNAGSSQD